jgi:hypothetical protein
MNWIDVNEKMPEIEHIEKRTQFLLKGYIQLKDSSKKLEPSYMISRLCDYFDDDTILFEEKMNFYTTHWVEIIP